jgi:hypothetical protein
MKGTKGKLYIVSESTKIHIFNNTILERIMVMIKLNSCSNILAISVLASAFAGCTAMTTLPENKLADVASALVNKPIKSVNNVRSLGDKQLYDATASDGSIYSCSLSVLFGYASQRERCDSKK